MTNHGKILTCQSDARSPFTSFPRKAFARSTSHIMRSRGEESSRVEPVIRLDARSFRSGFFLSCACQQDHIVDALGRYEPPRSLRASDDGVVGVTEQLAIAETRQKLRSILLRPIGAKARHESDRQLRLKTGIYAPC